MSEQHSHTASAYRWAFFSLDGKQRGESRATKSAVLIGLVCGGLRIPKRFKVGTVRRVRVNSDSQETSGKQA